MTDLKERVARLEGANEHLATKADIAELKGELMIQIAAIEGQLETLLWAMPIAVAIVSLLVQWLASYFPKHPSS